MSEANNKVPVEDHARGMHSHTPKNSSSNIDSNRVLVTKRAIFRALYELMEERDFSKISVSDIIERAGTSRTTFYRCFTDKYDVVNWSYMRFKEINPQYSDQYYSFESSLRIQLQYLSKHRGYFSQALRYTGQNSLRDAMFKINEEYMLQCWHEKNGPQKPEYRICAMVQFVSAGLSKMIECWILKECNEDPEMLLEAIQEFMPQDLADALY